MRRLACAIGLLAACEASENEEPLMCDPLTDRIGTYHYSAAERSGGTCGPMPMETVMWTGSEPIPDNCALDAPDEITENGCRLRRRVTCAFQDDIGPFDVSFDAVTWQRDESGDTIEGYADVVGSDPAGVFCASTYDIRYDRV